MGKVYLKYYNEKEYKAPIECDFGPAWDMIWQGGLYAYKKNDIPRALIMCLIYVCFITLSFIIAPIPLAIIISIIAILLINLLFALNYNMIVIEAFIREGYLPMDTKSSDKLLEKGIYFKLQ